MTIVKYLDIEDVRHIHDMVQYRVASYGETLFDALAVVILNHANRHRTVTCVHGEWNGIKSDILPASGLPKCPNGHSLFETGPDMKLAVVREQVRG